MHDLIRTTITLPDEILRKGKERAKNTRRSFPKYVQVLIEQDLSRKECDELNESEQRKAAV